jgi:hypothetical protein
MHSLGVIHKKTSRRCALATLFWMLAAMTRGGTAMDALDLARDRQERAGGLRGVLDAACQTFQVMLPVIMAQQDRPGTLCTLPEDSQAEVRADDGSRNCGR